MTISVKVSVNGNYKCPISFKQGDRQENHVVSGFGRDTPNELYIPFYHGPDAMMLSVGPEVPDNGEPEPEPAPSEPTFGERAVGLSFNPGGRSDVEACKRAFAAEIDRLDALRDGSASPEQQQLATVAIREAQTAQMWAVKALTWQS